MPKSTSKADRGLRAATGATPTELDQLLQTPFLRRAGRRPEAARNKTQEPAQTGRPAGTCRASSAAGSHRRGERGGGAAAQPVRPLRRQAAPKSAHRADARRTAAASGYRTAADPAAHHRVSIPRRGVWPLRKDYACATARGDRRTVWTAIGGADRLSDGGLPLTSARGGSPASASRTFAVGLGSEAKSAPSAGVRAAGSIKHS